MSDKGWHRRLRELEVAIIASAALTTADLGIQSGRADIFAEKATCSSPLHREVVSLVAYAVAALGEDVACGAVVALQRVADAAELGSRILSAVPANAGLPALGRRQ